MLTSHTATFKSRQALPTKDQPKGKQCQEKSSRCSLDNAEIKV